jgi:hypothetical protein
VFEVQLSTKSDQHNDATYVSDPLSIRHVWKPRLLSRCHVRSFNLSRLRFSLAGRVDTDNVRLQGEEVQEVVAHRSAKSSGRVASVFEMS